MSAPVTAIRATVARATVRVSPGALLVAAGLVLLAGWGGYKAWRITSLVRALDARAGEAQALLAGGPTGADSLPAAQALVHATRADVLALRAEAGPLLMVAPALGWLPVYGGDLAAAPQLLVIADELTLAGELALEGLGPLADPAGLSGEGGLAAATAALAAARGPLGEAEAALARARAARAQIDAARLSERSARLVARLDTALPLLALGLQAGLGLPDVLGWSGPRTYLILVQNDDELRPTGGFITALGVLRLEGGAIAELRFLSSYAVDDFSYPYPRAPEPISRTMGIGLWVLRDSNWSPDFPAAARQAVALFELTQPERIDGVVAIDQPLVELLVGALGPFAMEGYPEPVTGANVIAFMREAWAEGKDGQHWRDWAEGRKRFIPELAGALMARAQDLGEPGRVAALARAVVAGLEGRHLLVYLPDSAVAPLLAARGWDGALRPAGQDALLVVDWNAGYNKTSASVAVALDYRVDLSAAEPQARLTITYTNRAPATDGRCHYETTWGPNYTEQTERCYWTYVRAFAAPGSALLAASEHFFQPDEFWHRRYYTSTVVVEPDPSGRAVFGNFVLVPRAETRTSWFEYRLPAGVVAPVAGGPARRYALLAQKQPGTRGHALAVAVTLPPGARVLSATAGAVVDGQVVRWVTDLTVDRDFEVVYGP
jgi:hypothetical protein